MLLSLHYCQPIVVFVKLKTSSMNKFFGEHTWLSLNGNIIILTEMQVAMFKRGRKSWLTCIKDKAFHGIGSRTYFLPAIGLVCSWYFGMRGLPSTIYLKKYAHGFVVLCFVVVMQSFIMNSHEVFIHIHQGCFAGTGAIVRLPQCQ